MIQRKTVLIILALIAIAYLVFGMKKDDTNVPSDIPSEISQKIIIHAAKEYNIPAKRITLKTLASSEWSDSCLGLGGPAESCLQAITPGYHANLTIEGEQHSFRTNQDASVIREAK